MKKHRFAPPAACHPKEKSFALGMCRGCYRARVQSRKPERRKRTVDEVIHDFVDRSPEWGGCHLWMGGFGQWGTPQQEIAGRTTSVRRLVWENLHGTIPEGRNVTTNCNVSPCLNPDHISLRVVGGDIIERFWEKVVRSGPTVRAGLDMCWSWLAGHQKGYPVFFPTPDRRVFAHRQMYELMVGPIPTNDGEWCVCHRCDNPGCVNPGHMFLGRDKDNIHDAINKGRMAWQKKRQAVPPIGTDPK